MKQRSSFFWFLLQLFNSLSKGIWFIWRSICPRWKYIFT